MKLSLVFSCSDAFSFFSFTTLLCLLWFGLITNRKAVPAPCRPLYRTPDGSHSSLDRVRHHREVETATCNSSKFRPFFGFWPSSDKLTGANLSSSHWKNELGISISSRNWRKASRKWEEGRQKIGAEFEGIGFHESEKYSHKWQWWASGRELERWVRSLSSVRIENKRRGNIWNSRKKLFAKTQSKIPKGFNFRQRMPLFIHRTLPSQIFETQSSYVRTYSPVARTERDHHGVMGCTGKLNVG